LPVPKVGFP